MTTSVVDNGVNVEALLGARDAFADAPGIAQFQWRSTATWVNGTHSQAGVETFFGFGEEQQHRRRSASTSTTRCSSPRRTTASRRWSTCWSRSAAACAGIAAVAQQREIQLRSVQATVAAEMDLHGILGADPDVRNGFSGVKVHYRIDADATPEEIEALVAQSQKRSAVYDILTNPTDVTVDVY